MSEATTIIVNGAEGLTMPQAAKAWPCSRGTFQKILDARDADGAPILRTYPLYPGSTDRRTTWADLQACRERLRALELADLNAAIAALHEPQRTETFADAVERKRREREQRRQNTQRR